MENKEVCFALVIVVLLALLLASGCGKDSDCEEPMVLINDTCCLDVNNDSLCDMELNASNETSKKPKFNITIPETCGDGNCTAGEDCRNCWHDCGPCKQIVYVYIPRNFTLAELTKDIDEVTPDTVKFRKDIYNYDNVSNFFYFSKDIVRYFADFLDVKYALLKSSRWILLNHIVNDAYYVNDSDSLVRYVNFTDWYRIYSIKNFDSKRYEERILSGKALDDYPTQVTGYQKEFRYEDWEFRNFTKKEDIILKNITPLDNGMVESVYMSLTQYNITYKFHTFFTDKYGDENIILEDFRVVEEDYLTNIHTMNFRCARNLVITLYSYDYDRNYYNINREDLAEQARLNRQGLIKRANDIKYFCDRKYGSEVFTYT